MFTPTISCLNNIADTIYGASLHTRYQAKILHNLSHLLFIIWLRTITLLTLLTKKQAHKGEVVEACKPGHETKSI